jgi:flagellar basal body P-ring formation protein FlgA
MAQFTGRRGLQSVLLLAVAAWVMPAWAQVQAGPVEALARQWLVNAIAATAHPGDAEALRMDVAVGALDSRLQLAPCKHMEAFLPAGNRLWGKSRVGVRCVEGVTRWSVSLPVTVSAWGKAWVAKTALPAGTVLKANDVVVAQADWAAQASPVVQKTEHWLGLVTARPLIPGQAICTDGVRAAQLFAAGSLVKVVAQGAGFRISSDGQAITAGALGQIARVRLDNGRVASGVVLDAKTVQIEL